MKSAGGSKMKSKRKVPQRDWTKTLPYAALVLLATLITAGAGAYSTIKTPATPPPAPTSAPTPTPTSLAHPSPSPGVETRPRNPLTAADVARQQSFCREWISAGSGKRYNFVCRDQDVFDVYVLSAHGPERIGTGTILKDNSVETDVVISPRNRAAQPRNSHWNLKLSANGKKLEGMHSGDDPRETFQLSFHRVP